MDVMKATSHEGSKRVAVLTALVLMALLLSAEFVFAEKVFYVPETGYKDGFRYHIFQGETDPAQGSFIMEEYDKSLKKTDIILPVQVTDDKGNKYPQTVGSMQVGKELFKGDPNIKKIAVPKGIEALSSGVFQGCPALEEIAIEGDFQNVGENMFSGCPNLKTYRLGSTDGNYLRNSGIGQDLGGNIYEGVTVYVKKGSPLKDVINEINEASQNGNKITVIEEDDPYAGKTVKPSEEPSDGGSGDNVKPDGTPAKDRTQQMGSDGTPCGEGASLEACDKALTSLSGEKDPAGSVFGILQLKVKKAKKNLVALKWKGSGKAKNYVVYGSKCGKKNKLAKLASVTGSGVTFKKIGSAKVKKGTYYKFIVVAVDGNSDVISTSKSVHVATPGGKVGNHKKVTSKAKKNKVTLKAKKSFKLKAKAVPASKKLKVKTHRKVAYESSDRSVATVSGKGVIKGMKKGKCFVYCYAQNGVFQKVKVTVK